MGNTWEVYAWRKMDESHKTQYDFVLVYAGESWLSAVWNFMLAKRSAGCVKIEWR